MADKKTMEIEIPKGIEVKVDDKVVNFKGPKGESQREVINPEIVVEIKDNKIIIRAIKETKREKKLINTYTAHFKNLLKGAQEGHKYVLKVCSSHFPMNVAVNNNKVIIKNFIGEKFPRTLAIKEGVQVKVEGDLITVESANKELAGTAASDIEKLTKRPNFDTRIFQDGIYIINKDGKDIK